MHANIVAEIDIAVTGKYTKVDFISTIPVWVTPKLSNFTNESPCMSIRAKLDADLL